MSGIRVDRAVVEPVAVGASEVAAMLACDPWTTPLALYRRKRRLEADREDSQAMRIGRALEGPVVALARELIPVPIRRNRTTFAHRGVPLFATPDAFVGSDRVLEAKVVGIHGLDGWGDDAVPCRVRLQVQAQLAVTGRTAGYVAALIGTELRLVVLEADPELQASILEAATSFVVDHLDPGVPPDPLSWDERWAELIAAADELPELDVLAGADVQDWGDRVLEARAEVRELEDEQSALRLELLRAMTAASGTRLVGNGWTGSLQHRPGLTAWRPVASDLEAVLRSLGMPPVEVDQLVREVVTKHTNPATSTFVVRTGWRSNHDS